MERRRRRLRLAVLLTFGFVVGAFALAPPVGAEEAGTRVADLDPATRTALVEAARAYFDPELEFLYGPRKALLAQFEVLRKQGIEPLEDLDFLKSLVYEGRRFLPRFSDTEWRKLNNVDTWEQTQDLYNNLVSERSNFSFTLPKSYPDEQDLDQRRTPPYPLLMVFHEAEDCTGADGEKAPFPGSAVLARRYPKEAFSKLYEDGFLLAPVAPNAAFVGEDGRVRHRFSTRVLTDFWRRYQIDFDRIVLDGRLEAAALASVFPHVFAGVVLRGGDIPTAWVTNISTVPIYVVGDAALEQSLVAAGHPDVTFGDEKGILPWLAACKRTTPLKFSWRAATPEHLFANWIKIGEAEISPETGLDVEVIDTEEHPNTIRIDARGIGDITLYLNDDICDLDREVTLLLNGTPKKLGKLRRDFAQLFEREPRTRRNMYFGWLYTACVPEIRLSPSTAGGAALTAGDPARERKAKKCWEKALAAEAAGDTALARAHYQAVVDCGATSFRAKAILKLQDEPVLEQAARLREEGKIQEAIALLLPALEDADGPTALLLHETLGALRMDMGEPYAALQHLEAVLEERDEGADHLRLAEALLGVARENLGGGGASSMTVTPYLLDALDQAEQAGDGEDVDAWRKLIEGEVRYWQGDLEAALQDLEAVKMDALDTERAQHAAELRAQVTYRLGRPTEAAKAFAEAGNLRGEAAAWAAAKNPEETARAYTQLLEAAPTYDPALVEDAVRGARFAKAEAALAATLEKIQGTDLSPGNAAHLLLARAGLEEARGEREKALTLLAQAARRDLSDPRPLVEMGRLAYAKGDDPKGVDEAVRLWLLALERAPENERVVALLWDQAGRDYEAAWRSERALARTLRIQEALTRIAPDDGLAWANFGNTLRVAGRHEEAVEAYRRAQEAEEDDPGIASDAGLALSALGRPAEALAAFLRAAILDPDHTAAHQNAARALWLQGDDDGAARHLGQALDAARRAGMGAMTYRALLDRIWRTRRQETLR